MAFKISRPPRLKRSRSTASSRSTFPISVSGLNSSNYLIALVNGTLTITPAALTVTANNANKVSGKPNPTFTVSYSGFVNGDTASSLSGMLIFSTPATTSSPAGLYVITPSGLTSNNYAITFVSGTLAATDPSSFANGGG